MNEGMKMGELARVTGVKAPTIRFYEGIGLLPEPARTGGNYRAYAKDHVDRLHFIRRARDLGFDLPEVRSLLELAEPAGKDCDELVRIAIGHRDEVDRKTERLARLRRELDELIANCSRRLVSEPSLLRCFDDRPAGDDGSGGRASNSKEHTAPRR